MATLPEKTVHDLKAMMDDGTSFVLLDVREPDEYDICNLGGQLLPLRQLPFRVQELQEYKEALVVVHCRSGGRSAQAAEFLQSQGFSDVYNLKGGILAWSAEIDPSMPTY
ncbi:MAG: rhodanese-like domain-containing protein [Bacteroidota bacterium]